MIKLNEKELTIVTQILKRHLPNHNFYIVGSRAKGNVHEYSDLDIAIEGNVKQDPFRVDWNLLEIS